MLKAYKYRIYPNTKQESLLNQTFGCVRKIWNYNVEIFNKYNKDCSLEKQEKPLTSTQLRREFVYMKDISYTALQQKERDFAQFKSSYFSKSRKSKVGRPQFKFKDDKQSFRLANGSYYIKEKLIHLEKIGKVKIVVDREISKDYRLMNVTVSKNKSNQFFASVLVEQEIILKPKTGKQIGIDVGLKTFLTGSDNLVIENPRYFRNNQAKLAKVQRRFSRKKKVLVDDKKVDSIRRKKAKLKVARVSLKVANQRKDFMHKLTTRIVTDYDFIAIEDLNVSGMVKNHKLAKSISDASFSEFSRQLEYKCFWYGKHLIKVDSWFASSKICNHCGWKNKELSLGEGIWQCKSCLMKIDRDLNASKNILKEALRVNNAIRTQTCHETGMKRLKVKGNL